MSELGKMNEALYERLGEIVKTCCDMRMTCDPELVDGPTPEEANAALLAAFASIRQMVEFYKPEAKEPVVPGCPSLMPRQLPGGFDGTEPGTSKGEATSSSLVEKAETPSPISGEDAASPLEKAKLESEAKLEASVERMRGNGKLFKDKHISSCHGTYIYDYICINDAHIRASLHFDDGGLKNHAMLWVGDGERCFCHTTFNTSSAVKCDYLVRGMICGLAKRLVYHHKNLIKRRAKRVAAREQQAHDNKGAAT